MAPLDSPILAARPVEPLAPAPAVSPGPAASLTYGGPTDTSVLRPLLWLVLLMPVPGLIEGMAQVWYWSWTLATAQSRRDEWAHLSAMGGDSVMLMVELIRIPVALLVMVRAIAALSGRPLPLLARACGLLAGVSLLLAIVSVRYEWAFAWSRSISLERLLQLTLLRARSTIGGAVLPAGAFVVLRQLSRRVRPVSEGNGYD